MSIKFADEIAKEIKERGQIQDPDGCVTGESYEEWLYDKAVNICEIFSNQYDDSNCSGE